MEDRIVKWADYGEHINFRCSVCGGEGHSKNIAPFGCRSIFSGDIACICQTYNDWNPIVPDNADELEKIQNAKTEKRDYIENNTRRITELRDLFLSQNPNFDIDCSNGTGVSICSFIRAEKEKDRERLALEWDNAHK